jgi:hypothetical protein
MLRRGLALLWLAAIASCSGSSSGTTDVVELGDVAPGEVVGLTAVESDDGRFADVADRLDGTIRRLDIDDPNAGFTTLATIPVGTDGAQRGLLGQVIIDEVRYAAWTQPETLELVIGEVVGDVVGDVVGGAQTRIVWSGGRAGDGAIGGALGEIDGQILLGLGRNTSWDAETNAGGALLVIDPAGSADQNGIPLSVGYTNPWAFTVTQSGEVWVADNAAGPDPDNTDVDDIERIGRGDLVSNRNDLSQIDGPGRAPTSMVELPDGRIGICGFLDNELRAYEAIGIDTVAGERTTLDRAGQIMPCNLGVAVYSDGTVITLAQTESGESLQIRRP